MVVEEPTPPAVVIAPSSERPVTRVYAETEPGFDLGYSELPPRVIILDAQGNSTASHSVRRLFEAQPTLAMRARHSRINVRDGNLLLEGWVETEEDEKILRYELGRLPGVNRIESRLTIRSDQGSTRE